MKTQLSRNLTMLALVIALTVIAVGSANAQSKSPQTANVPFAFTVGSQNMPAGEYKITSMNSAGETLRVTGEESTAIRLTITARSQDPVNQSKLVFHRYGDRYFLAEVWTAGNQTGRQLVTSNEEKALRHELARSNRTNYERVDVALAK